MAPRNRRFLLETIIFRFHVKLGECIPTMEVLNLIKLFLGVGFPLHKPSIRLKYRWVVSMLGTWSVGWTFQAQKGSRSTSRDVGTAAFESAQRIWGHERGVGSKVVGLTVVSEFVYPLEVQQFAPEKMVVGRRSFPIGRLRFVWAISNLRRVGGAKSYTVEI